MLISVTLLFVLIGLAFSIMFGHSSAGKNLPKLILTVLLAAIVATLLVHCWLVMARVALTIAVAVLMLLIGIRAVVNAL